MYRRDHTGCGQGKHRKAWATYKLGAVLVDGKVNSTVGATANLILDDVLVDAVVTLASLTLAGKLCNSIESFLVRSVSIWYHGGRCLAPGASSLTLISR
jgi:hypothetical protein